MYICQILANYVRLYHIDSYCSYYDLVNPSSESLVFQKAARLVPKFLHLWSPHISCRKHGKSIPRCVSPGSWTQSSRILKYSSCRAAMLKIDIGETWRN